MSDTHDRNGFPITASPFAAMKSPTSSRLGRLADDLSTIACRLAQLECTEAMRARYAGPHGWVDVPPKPETIARHRRLRADLLTEAEEVAVTIQEIVRGEQPDQVNATVEA